jgi:hypothetical protein
MGEFKVDKLSNEKCTFFSYKGVSHLPQIKKNKEKEKKNIPIKAR